MIGQTLGHYHIVEKIGAGGMGVVFRARDERLDRDVALKVLPASVLADEGARKRFRKEALTLSKLSHANIAAVYDFDTQDGVDFLVMEYLPGETLASRLRGGALPQKDVLTLGIQIVSALQEANEQGVVHRDLKPGNIIVTPKGHAKVLDFGLAKLLRSSAEAEVTVSMTETQTGAGTLPYMAPEQLRGEPADERSDIYAAGAVLYEMATGQRPFPETHGPRLIDSILHGAPQPPSSVNRRILPGLESIILKALDNDPERRYQSARELRVDLDRLSAPPQMVAPRRRRSRQGVDSVAVMPFENAGADPDVEYLSDGIAESIIYSLSQLPELRVMARSTVFRYKGKKVDAQALGRELNVGAVLTGRLIQRGNVLIIGVELVDVANGWQLWGEQYNRKVADILAVQEEISREISEKLQLRLTAEQKSRLTKRPTRKTEAYQLYLKGRYWWNKWTVEGSHKAIEYFQQALQIDPHYALAHAGLADSYASLGSQVGLPPREAMPKAKEAALKALELDDTLAEAHTSLGLIKLSYDWEWTAAEREFKRAIDLNPNSTNTYHWYAHLMTALGRTEDSLAASLRALELDPLDLELGAHLAWQYIQSGQYDQAIEQCQKTIEMDPNFHEPHWFLGRAYEQNAMLEKAIGAFEKAVALSGGGQIQKASLGHAYALAGKRSEAESVLQDLDELSHRQYVPSYHIAAIHLGLGEKDRAFELLEKAYQERSGWMPYLRVDPLFHPLRSDPRFADLLRRVGLPL